MRQDVPVRHISQFCALSLFCSGALLACTDEPAVDDRSLGGAGSGSQSCDEDSDCDDGQFCNGVELCVQGSCSSAAAAACAGACDEDAQSCSNSSCDEDGDGHESLACGGDDCDDTDPDRFPGNPEVCDFLGHDEDCDPSSLGDDRDQDGFVSDECCNANAEGVLVCGTDCDDGRATINETALDTCGGGDENCNGMIDEDQPPIQLYQDRDGDGFGCIEGDTGCLTRSECSVLSGWSATSGDCNDDPATGAPLNPGATEICDGVDNDCSGTADDPPGGACACTNGAERECGPPTSTGACVRSVHSCVAGAWPQACAGATYPEDELCDAAHVDEDCDGQSNEDCACDTCGLPGESVCVGNNCDCELAPFSTSIDVVDGLYHSCGQASGSSWQLQNEAVPGQSCTLGSTSFGGVHVAPGEYRFTVGGLLRRTPDVAMTLRAFYRPSALTTTTLASSNVAPNGAGSFNHNLVFRVDACTTVGFSATVTSVNSSSINIASLSSLSLERIGD